MVPRHRTKGETVKLTPAEQEAAEALARAIGAPIDIVEVVAVEVTEQD